MTAFKRASIPVIIMRLVVYGILVLATSVFWLSVLAFLAGTANAALPDVYVPFRWTVNTARPAKQEIIINRGETVALEPTYQSYDGPVDLTNVYEVRLRYRSADMPADTYYAATGSVVSTTGGVVRILWGPEHETTNSVFIYDIKLSGSDSASLKASGTIRLAGAITGTSTNQPSVVTGQFDWGSVEHVNIDEAPFVDAGDLLNVTQRLDGHDQDIIDLTGLVGDGVAGVESNLQAHIGDQVIRDAAQDEQITLALESATMGGDIAGQSTNATVVKIQGRALPPANEVPQNNQAMIWDTALGRWVHKLVDLSPIQAAISNLQATAVTQTYVDTEISTVRGLVDGNDHTHMLMESFASADWLEIAAGVFQHNSGWMAYNATMINGQITLMADVGYLVMGGMTQCVSRIVTTPTAANWAAQYAATDAGPWTGYDTVRDNIVSTNKFAVKFVNTGGTGLTLAQVDFYTWTFPERVAYSRDFAGLHLLVDTPPGDQLREAVNVQYVRTLAASNDISGTFATGFAVDKIKGGSINATARANGLGLLWYSSVNEHRYVDLATQFELDAAVNLLCTIAAHNALVARVTAVEAGAVPLGGDLSGTAASGTVQRIRGKVIDQPTADQTSPVYDLAQNKIVWQSVLSSNVVYAAGTNDIANVPAGSAAFYRAMSGTNAIMPIVLDQQIVGWFGADGLTLPYGTLNLMESNLTANVQMYDGSAATPALGFLSDPTTGWYRAAANAWRFMSSGNLVADLSNAGITMGIGKDIILKDGFRAASIDEIDDLAFTETDPLAVHKSTTTQVWTHVGGTYTNEGVLATSDVSSNGFAAVTYDLATGNGMSVIVEMSDLNLTEWTAFAPFAYPGYVRVSLAETLPPPGGVLDTTISNIAATAWTRPDLYSNVTDTAGQIIHVDTAVQARQPVPLAQLQAGLAGVTPSTWSQYDATQDVNLDGKMLLMGNGWTVSDVSGLGVISYTDLAVATNTLQIAANLVPAITATAGYSGLTIATLSIDGGTGTVGVATNGVTSTPILQWTASLSSIQWQNLTPISETYPSTNAAGHYEIVAELPSESAGFLRAVQADGTSRVDVGMPLYEMGERVATSGEVAAVSGRVDTIEAWPAATFAVEGTNLLWISGGVTNQVILGVWP